MPALTPEQEAIVRHGEGPALVFAVAGAGKTTAMVHRIERLVREGVFPPERILATSFSRAATADLRRALGPWDHCAPVRVTTLHAVGLSVVRQAEAEGLIRPHREVGDHSERVLYGAFARARHGNAGWASELDTLDTEDFLTYVGAQKGGLAYPDVARAGLVPEAEDVAVQAEAPPERPWYLDLYRLFEEARREAGVLTFDDMLLTAWEVLVSAPALREALASRYACVVVDEFQDVNRAQSEILDLLTAGHRNYMAIGDDDQTIYEWRGASPRYILDFARRYDARTYHIRDNFRSGAAALCLANGVIRHNRRREPKRLSPTRGFTGAVHVHRHDDAAAQARHIAGAVEAALAAGRRGADVAVLVRLYAQTPPLEAAFIERGIGHRIVGGEAFYRRRELALLLRYLTLGGLEAGLMRGVPLDASGAAAFRRFWPSLYNRPNRYFARALADEVARLVLDEGCTLGAALRAVAAQASAGSAGHIESLAETFGWLASLHHNREADAVLTALEARLRYKAFLRESSPVTGRGKAAGVDALIRYAGGKGTPADFIDHLRDLARAQGDAARDAGALVTISSVHRAKGLQWPVVIVPDVNQGVLPADDDGAELEEERRLFYVAVTRTQEDLHLHALRTAPLSQFMKEGAYRKTLLAVDGLADVLGRDPASWSTGETLALARDAHRLGLGRYVTTWWDAPAERKRAAAHRVASLAAAAEAAGLSDRLRLSADAAAFWTALGPFDAPLAPDAFPDLEDHVPPLLAPGQPVVHPTFGPGEVVEVSGPEGDARVRVRFAAVGEKKLVAARAGLKAGEE